MKKYGEYNILQETPLGSGGNANVYLAKKRESKEKVALKVLKKGGRYFKEKVSRFCIESRLVQSIQDEVQGIIPIYTACLPDKQNDNEYWYAMPLAQPLSDVINKNTNIDDIVECIIQLAEVMIILHERGIVHRDIKPSNIYFYKERYCFGDFGLVDYPEKEDLTKLHESVGPKATIAPEMKHNAKESDGRKADVYSLAKTLWMLLTNNEYGFEGIYDESSKLMGLSNKYRNVHLVELEELLFDATREDPRLRPSMKEFSERLREWKNIKDDFEESNLSQWRYVQKRLFGQVVPDTAIWSNLEDIVNVLNLLGRMPNLNHMFVPSGGGTDLESAEIAGEEGCIALKTLGIEIVKPKRLIVENISKDYMWSYFRLELEELAPFFEETYFEFEELTEDTPGHYGPMIWGNYGYYEDGTPLPRGYRMVARYLRGSFVIFLKTSIYNQINGTYDGRHNKMDTGEFREYIEGLRRMSHEEEPSEFVRIANISPVKEEEDLDINNIKIEDALDTDKYIKDNYLKWDFSELMLRYKKQQGKKIVFFIRFIGIYNPGYSYYLNTKGKFVERDSIFGEYTNPFYLYDRNEVYQFIDECKQLIENKCKDQGIEFTHYSELFEVGVLRIGAPEHLFTKDELKQVLKEGNDHITNTLVINEDGYLMLVQDISRATYPVRFESFCAYNNYVGKYASLTYLDDEYIMALQGWLHYLKTNKSTFMEYVEEDRDEESLLRRIGEYYK